MYEKLKELIKKTTTPITKNDIKNALINLGLNAKSKVEVHTSLSSFGYIVNKAYDVIDALMETISEGVIIMPAHTSEQTNPRQWSNPSVPEPWYEIIENHRKPFDPQVILPERVGDVARAFLMYPNVKRTSHPEVSLAIYNKTGDQHWLDHDFDDRQLIHPLYKLKEEGGKILMMGTDFYTCTSIHLTEFLSEYATLEQYDYHIKMGDQIVKKTITTKYFDDDDLNFKIISERYVKQYQNTRFYKQTKVGLATITLIDAKKLYDVAKAFHLKYKPD